MTDTLEKEQRTKLKVLVVTNMYPTPARPDYGIFVQEQVEALRREGVTIDILFIKGMDNKLDYLWGVVRLWARLLTRRYDLVHAHYVFSGIVARFQFLRPVVLTHHGCEVFTSWQRFPSRLINGLVDKVILVSREQREKLHCHNAEVIPCGINLEFFKPIPREEARHRLGMNGEKGKKLVLVLASGNLSRPVKRYDIIKEAVALARQKDPRIELVAISRQPHHTIPLYMSACDVLLLVSDAEGSPMVIKEAMACGLPVVSVPVGDVPEVIGGTEGCYLCSREIPDVAAKLHLALAYAGRTSGRENIRHLEQSVIAKQITAVYEKLLRERNGKSDAIN